MKKIVFVLLWVLIFNNLGVRAAVPSDSICLKGERFSPSGVLVPAAVISVGATGLWIGGMKDLNRHINDGMADWRGNHKPTEVDDYLQFVPFAAYEGLGLVGVRCRHKFRDRLLAGITAELAVEILTQAWKVSVNETRPDGTRHSFPSGHAARAFAGAELIRLDYGIGAGIAAYTFAAGVGVLRLYNNRHWFTDVIAGAGIGLLSAHIGEWLLPVYRRWFGRNSRITAAALPSYDPYTRSAGLALAIRL